MAHSTPFLGLSPFLVKIVSTACFRNCNQLQRKGKGGLHRRIGIRLPLYDHRDAGRQEPDQHDRLANERSISGSRVETGDVRAAEDRRGDRQVHERRCVGKPAGPLVEHACGQGGVARRGQHERRQDEPEGSKHGEAALHECPHGRGIGLDPRV